jgi:hypothetical protein
MRLLRLSLLVNYFRLIKNKKKALTIINIGIFLSLFALSSAVISFQIEKEINKLENSLIEYKNLRNSLSGFLVKLETSSSLYDINMINEERNWEEIRLLTSAEFGSKILSNNDFYLPTIISLFRSGILHNSLYGEDIINHMLDKADDKLDKEMQPVFDSFLESRTIVLEVDFNKYEKEIYHVSKIKLLEEITNTNKFSMRNYDSKIYKDYRKVKGFLYDLREYRLQVKDYLRGVIDLSIERTKEENNKIIKLSKREKNLILTTFFFQFLIFIIIQFFEFSSIQDSRKRSVK